jgi:hypothetical protein
MTSEHLSGLRRELDRAVAVGWFDATLARLLVRDAERRVTEAAR